VPRLAGTAPVKKFCATYNAVSCGSAPRKAGSVPFSVLVSNDSVRSALSPANVSGTIPCKMLRLSNLRRAPRQRSAWHGVRRARTATSGCPGFPGFAVAFPSERCPTRHCARGVSAVA
jgi:hypothetical protein